MSVITTNISFCFKENEFLALKSKYVPGQLANTADNFSSCQDTSSQPCQESYYLLSQKSLFLSLSMVSLPLGPQPVAPCCLDREVRALC